MVNLELIIEYYSILMQFYLDSLFLLQFHYCVKYRCITLLLCLLRIVTTKYCDIADQYASVIITMMTLADVKFYRQSLKVFSQFISKNLFEAFSECGVLV